MSRKVSSTGFSIVEGLIVVVVVAIIGLGGWWVWRHNHQQKKTATSSGSTTNQTGKQSSGTQSSDPYAGWKSYCDTAHKACFKYPANWTLTANTDQVTVLNPANNLEVDYIAPYVHDSGLLAFQPVSITDLASAGLSLKVVGGIYATANEPDYGVVNASLLTSNPLTVGQQTNFPNALRFTDSLAMPVALTACIV